VSVLAPAMYLSCPCESDRLVTQRTRLFIFGTCIKNVALRDPKVNHTRGELTHAGHTKIQRLGMSL